MVDIFYSISHPTKQVIVIGKKVSNGLGLNFFKRLKRFLFLKVRGNGINGMAI
jgi:hypothetical protein